MSFGMWAVPGPKDPPAPVSLYELKHAFAETFMPKQAGSLRDEIEIKGDKFRATVITWLRGYGMHRETATYKATQELINLIEENPQGVTVWIGDWMDGPYGDTTEPKDDE